LARLNHRNIAQLFDGGITNDGRPYFAMEYVNGIPINEYCDQKRLTIRQRLILFRQVCNAVHYAHKNLIVHRDLKPSNIIVTNDGDLKLLDFGIAKLLDDSNGQTLTQTGMQLHTPAYASPEQLTNDLVTTASDIYALGILFFEILSGQRPFEPQQTPKEFRESVLTTKPLKPSEAVTEISLKRRDNDHSRNLEEIGILRGVKTERLQQQLKGDLDTICLTAMHREPDRRYTSASEFAAKIKRHLDGRPVLARPDSAIYRFKKLIQRNRPTAIVGSVAFVTLVTLIIFYTVQLAKQRDLAIVERQKAEEIADFVTGLFEISDPSESKGEKISAKDLLDAGASRVQTELVKQPIVQQTLRRVLGEVYYKLGDEKNRKNY